MLITDIMHTHILVPLGSRNAIHYRQWLWSWVQNSDGNRGDDHRQSHTKYTPRTIHLRNISTSGILSILSSSYLYHLAFRIISKSFWRNIIQCSHILVFNDTCLITIEGTRDTKVNQFQCSLNKDEVGRLQVAVNDVLVMNCIHRNEHLMPNQSQEVHVVDTIIR